MKHLSVIVTFGLAGLSYAPIAAAQRHTDFDSVERIRMDRTTIRMERAEVSRAAVASERFRGTERSQEGAVDRAERSRAVAVRSVEAGHPSPEPARLGPTGAAAMQRVMERTASGEESQSGLHEVPAQHSDSYAYAHPQTVNDHGEHAGPAAAAAMQRAMNRTAVGEDSMVRNREIVAQHSEVGAAPATESPGAGAQPQRAGLGAAIALMRAMMRVAVGEDSSGRSHNRVEPQSGNGTP